MELVHSEKTFRLESKKPFGVLSRCNSSFLGCPFFRGNSNQVFSEATVIAHEFTLEDMKEFTDDFYVYYGHLPSEMGGWDFLLTIFTTNEKWS